MTSFLYVVLTSSDLDACRRAVSTIPDGRNIAVVCNSTDPDYFAQIARSDLRGRCTLSCTHSNGTPGQGKQSVIDYFRGTEHDYLIMIDGDDFLHVHGGEIIENYVTTHHPDVMGLLNEDVMIDQEIFTDWRGLKMAEIMKPLDIPDPVATRDYFQDVFSLIVHDGCRFNRLVAMSQKAAKHVSWNTVLPGTEDVLLSAQLKLKHLQGELAYHIVESSDIYVYNKHTHGGTGFKVLTADAHACRAEFFNHFTPEEIEVLREAVLPSRYFGPAQTKFSRMKYAKKTIKAFA